MKNNNPLFDIEFKNNWYALMNHLSVNNLIDITRDTYSFKLNEDYTITINVKMYNQDKIECIKSFTILKNEQEYNILPYIEHWLSRGTPQDMFVERIYQIVIERLYQIRMELAPNKHISDTMYNMLDNVFKSINTK